MSRTEISQILSEFLAQSTAFCQIDTEGFGQDGLENEWRYSASHIAEVFMASKTKEGDKGKMKTQIRSHKPMVVGVLSSQPVLQQQFKVPKFKNYVDANIISFVNTYLLPCMALKLEFLQLRKHQNISNREDR